MDRISEQGWKLVGPRKKFWHFFRLQTSLCAGWALFNTTPPYLLLPPENGLICKRCLTLFNQGPQLVKADDASVGGKFHPGRTARTKGIVRGDTGHLTTVVDLVEADPAADPAAETCWAQEER